MGEKKIGERREPRISMRRGKDGGNVTVVYHRRVQEKLDDILNASFLYLTGHKHIFFLFLEPRDKRKFSQRNMYCMFEIHV